LSCATRTGIALAYIYFEDELGRQSTAKCYVSLIFLRPGPAVEVGERVNATWNERRAKLMPMLLSRTIGC
jgi:hypothetical protein